MKLLQSTFKLLANLLPTHALPIVWISIIFTHSGLAQVDDQPEDLRFLHALLGQGSQTNAWQLNADDGSTARADIDRLMHFGVFGQSTPLTGPIKVGYEVGGSVRFNNSNTSFLVIQNNGNLQARFSVDSQIRIVAFNLGVYGDYQPTKSLRFYAAGGPELAIGTIDINSNGNNPFTENSDNSNNDESNKTQATRVLGYARLGVDFILKPDTTIGLSVYRSFGELDFQESGKITLDEAHFLLSIGRKF